MQKIRAAVIGVGYLGRFHAQKYAQAAECELVAVADARQEAREKVAALIFCMTALLCPSASGKISIG